MLDANCTRSLTILALALAFVACGGDGGKSRKSCDTAAECGGGICFDSECYTACTSQDDCEVGEEFCVKRKDQQGVETNLCVVAADYDGCQLQADCAELVTGACENKGCDTTTGICYVRAKEDNVTCTTPEAHPGTCQAGVCTCTRDCLDRECGPDGCGAFCGASSVGACPKANEVCEDGQCICQPDCEGRECGSDGCGGLCGTHGGECTGLQDECIDGQCVCKPACDGKVCGPDGCGATCGECAGDQDVCVQGGCACAPDCLQKECGPDGCGAFCGELPEGACPGMQDLCNDGKCECQPQCVAIVEPTVGEPPSAICGPDGCGGFCGDLEEGACPGLQDACVDGVCACQPACDGRDCGADGCGATCGTCTGPQDQCLDGLCTCVPACDGKVCGPDGCGGTCGQLAGGCPGAQDTCLDGQCVCQPACDSRVCGPDGCGGECGVCKGCTTCDAGACVDDPCCLIPKTGCCDGQVLRICIGKQVQQQDCACNNELGIPCGVAPSCGWNPFAQVYSCGTAGGPQPAGDLPMACPTCQPACDGKECGPDGCGTGGTCGTCSPWDTCEAGLCTNVCEKACEGRECGSDGCGGACGECAEGQTCADDGQCVAACTPTCTGRQCGPDGCGGSCGHCGDGLFCNNGECSSTCIPGACGDRACGDDGCGGACGPNPEGACLDGLACTVDGSCGNWCTACTNDPTCSALGFESGNFFGWALVGDARVLQHLGDFLPVEGVYMASLVTGGLVQPAASATFDACLPVDVNLIELEWRAFSAEFEELCGQAGGDRVEIAVEGRVDHRAVVVLSASITDLCRPEACEGCGDQFLGLDLVGTSVDEGDVWGTPWTHLSAPLRTLLATNQGQVRLSLRVLDGENGTLGSRLLVDDVRFLACDPQCTGRECGADACGGFCGDGETGLCPSEADVCTSTGECCTPACFPDQQCGSNGCEGSCGACAANEACELGFCVCQPDCTGKTCGGDGCGGVCGDNDGVCANPDDVCLDDGTCCTPACEGLECGDNGCGGDCWFTTHPDSLFCGVDTEAVCVAGACCLPDCSEKQCGDDGCGGDCGACPGAQDACVDFQCQCQPACDGFACGDDGCDGSCGTCEGAQDACVDHQCVCQPACLDLQCGDDGCGNDCWWVQNPEATSYCGSEQAAVCVGGACCTPQCTDKACGTDGCGGSCGTCEAGFACDGAACIEGAVFCADEDLCTVDLWDNEAGACEHPPVDCADADPTTHDSCVPATGACDHVPCTPGCGEAWQCGVDDCGDSCGVCEGAQDACVDHQCVCQPACATSGAPCGDDGCGGSCGTCEGKLQCQGGTCVAVWVCDPSTYNADDGCDCECGVYDPDCDNTTLPVYNCTTGQVCDANGHCLSL